jgi:hypothetical protein
VWALGNIAGDSPQCRDLVLQSHAMFPLLQQLHANSKLSMLRNATWTLSNFCRGKPQPDFEIVKAALPTLAQVRRPSRITCFRLCPCPCSKSLWYTALFIMHGSQLR